MVGIIPLWLTCIIPLWPTRRQADGESVHRASDSPPATVQNMGVDHGCSNIGVPEQFLNRADVVAIFKQVRGNAFKPFDSFEPFESLERLSGPFKLLAFHRAVLQITDKVANHNRQPLSSNRSVDRLYMIPVGTMKSQPGGVCCDKR